MPTIRISVFPETALVTFPPLETKNEARKKFSGMNSYQAEVQTMIAI